MLSESNISGMLENIPTFSQSALRIIDLTSDITSSSKDLVQQITHDPILTARVLKLVNSAFFGLSREVESIQQSVVYIGINTIKNLAISVAAMGALPRTNNAGLDMDHFWLHSLVTASTAKLLAQQRGIAKADVSTYFIAGLLHDIGQIILSQELPEAYQDVLEKARLHEKTLCELEEEAFGMNHATIGAMLAEKWQLPADIVTAIRHHHGPTGEERNAELGNTIFVSGVICKSMEEDSSQIGRVDDIPSSIQDWLGKPVEEVVASLDTLQAEIDNARIFIK